MQRCILLSENQGFLKSLSHKVMERSMTWLKGRKPPRSCPKIYDSERIFCSRLATSGTLPKCLLLGWFQDAEIATRTKMIDLLVCSIGQCASSTVEVNEAGLVPAPSHLS